MGADLAAARPDVYDRYLDSADEASGLPIRALSLEGPLESLTETNAAQPALFALSLAVHEVAREAGLRPAVVAGHSLGEYTAAVAAGALSLEDGMRLVSMRGRLMAEIQAERPGAMAAVIGLPAERVRELCEEASATGSVSPANLNTPVQIVVSGEETAVERLMALAGEAGAEKVVRLQVGAAFHSELMKPVQDRLATEMEQVSWREPEVPLASNAFGGVIRTGDEVRAGAHRADREPGSLGRVRGGAGGRRLRDVPRARLGPRPDGPRTPDPRQGHRHGRRGCTAGARELHREPTEACNHELGARSDLDGGTS